MFNFSNYTFFNNLTVENQPNSWAELSIKSATTIDVTSTSWVFTPTLDGVFNCLMWRFVIKLFHEVYELTCIFESKQH